MRACTKGDVSTLCLDCSSLSLALWAKHSAWRPLQRSSLAPSAARASLACLSCSAAAAACSAAALRLLHA